MFPREYWKNKHDSHDRLGHARLLPFLIIQGSADKTVPANQSLAFQEKLKAAGVDCDLILIPEGQHRINDWKKFDPAWQGQLIAWLNAKLAAK